MAEIKAIETYYNGYRFRSRLEARWAVFFDAVGLEYQYEPEGFDLGDGCYYLPDFYLPESDVWIEVKGKQLTEEERGKIEKFCQAMCDQGDGNGGARFRLFEGEIPKESWRTPTGISGVPCFIYQCPREVQFLVKQFEKRQIELPKWGILSLGIWINPIFTTEKVNAALLKARQARFEHGEKPNL